MTECDWGRCAGFSGVAYQNSPVQIRTGLLTVKYQILTRTVAEIGATVTEPDV